MNNNNISGNGKNNFFRKSVVLYIPIPGEVLTIRDGNNFPLSAHHAAN